jgi:hypothetical protein
MNIRSSSADLNQCKERRLPPGTNVDRIDLEKLLKKTVSTPLDPKKQGSDTEEDAAPRWGKLWCGNG